MMNISLTKFKIKNKTGFGILGRDKIKEVKGSIFDKYEVTNNLIPLSEAEIIPPVDPTKIIALGYNYKDLVGPQKKYQEPVIFLKPPSSIITNNDVIKIPNQDKKVWVEVELAIIIKAKCKNVSEDQAHNYILGHTIGNDITTENINGRDHHLARSKGWDTFCSIGPHISINLDTSDLRMTTKINGEVFQDSSTKNRILNDTKIISLISRIMTLNPGDIILTGTPANAEGSIIVDGDLVELEIENMGTLKNIVRLIDEP